MSIVLQSLALLPKKEKNTTRNYKLDESRGVTTLAFLSLFILCYTVSRRDGRTDEREQRKREEHLLFYNFALGPTHTPS